MTTYKVDVLVEEMLGALNDALEQRGLETFSELPEALEIEVDASIAEDVFERWAAEEGYIHEDNILPEVEPETRDLREGLIALVQGDRVIAAALLQRAFGEWPDAVRAVEDVLLARTVHDRRQGALALAA